MLTGSDAVGARFGSAIASLGDINKDKYNGKASNIEACKDNGKI